MNWRKFRIASEDSVVRDQCPSVKQNSMQIADCQHVLDVAHTIYIGEYSELQCALLEVGDTASLAVGPRALGALLCMSSYEGTSTQMLAPNTMFNTRRTRSPSRSSAGSRRSRSVFPVGLTILQWQVQLAAHIASTAASGVEQVVAMANAMHNVAEQALTTALDAAGSMEDVVREHVQCS